MAINDLSENNGVYECICLPIDKWERSGLHLGMYYLCSFIEDDYVTVEYIPYRAWKYFNKQDFLEYFKKVIKDDVINKKQERE